MKPALLLIVAALLCGCHDQRALEISTLKTRVELLDAEVKQLNEAIRQQDELIRLNRELGSRNLTTLSNVTIGLKLLNARMDLK